MYYSIQVAIISMEKEQVVQQQEQKEENGRSEICICCEKIRNLPDNIVTGVTIRMTEVMKNFSRNKVHKYNTQLYKMQLQANMPTQARLP